MDAARRKKRSIALDLKSLVGLVSVNGAGKSTLTNVLGGIYGPDAGEIAIDSEKVAFQSPKDAEKHGLRREGKAIIYIMHFLDEVRDLQQLRRAPERQGARGRQDRHCDEERHHPDDRRQGHQLWKQDARESAHKPVLRVDKIRRGSFLRDISFALHEGENLGL